MSPTRPLLLALALLEVACAGQPRVARGNPLPPPAQVRAGTRDPGAGPVPGSSAPATAAAPHVRARAAPREAAVRREVETASALAGAREIVVGGVRYGDGCASLARAALDRAGAPLPRDAGDARTILALARSRGAAHRWRPTAGDLVFLAERPGGPAEHVGVVESVSPEGTALVLHQTERGVARLHVNAAHAWKTRGESGRVVNDLLVVGGGRLPAGRLLVAFATML
jgi:hypothetical protein